MFHMHLIRRPSLLKGTWLGVAVLEMERIAPPSLSERKSTAPDRCQSWSRLESSPRPWRVDTGPAGYRAQANLVSLPVNIAWPPASKEPIIRSPAFNPLAFTTCTCASTSMVVATPLRPLRGRVARVSCRRAPTQITNLRQSDHGWGASARWCGRRRPSSRWPRRRWPVAALGRQDRRYRPTSECKHTTLAPDLCHFI